MIDGYTQLKPFKFWVQKVLPTVYDDSLSYYELLNKLVQYLNEVGNDVTVLHDYVENYFTSLDVQNEIDNKLDAMAESGELSALINPVVINSVTDWLRENLTPTTPVVDSSFTIQGAAADSLAVGTKTFNEWNPENGTTVDPTAMPSNKYTFCTVGDIDARFRPVLPEATRVILFKTAFTNSRFEVRIYDAYTKNYYIRTYTQSGTEENPEYNISAETIAGSMAKENVDAVKWNVPDDINTTNKLYLHQIPVNSYVNIPGNYLHDTPWDSVGQVKVSSEAINASGYVRLISCTTQQGVMFYRVLQYIASTDTWGYATGWYTYTSGRFVEVTDVAITSSNKTNYFTDMNDAPLNTVYRIAANAHLDNSPYGDGTSSGDGVYTDVRDIKRWTDGTLITVGTGESYTHQIFIRGVISGPSSGYREPTNVIMNFRTKYGVSGWSNWRAVSDLLFPTATNMAIRAKMVAPYIETGTGNYTTSPVNANNEPNTVNANRLQFDLPYLDHSGNPVANKIIETDGEGGPVIWTSPINPQYGQLFDDCNNAPNNTMFQLDKDLTGDLMKNNPFPGISTVLITFSHSYTLRHGMIQLCVGVSTGNSTVTALRYGYNNPPLTWTNWFYLSADAPYRVNVVSSGVTLDGRNGNFFAYGQKQYITDFAEGGIFADCPYTISNATYLYIERKQLLPTSQASIYIIDTASKRYKCWRSGATPTNVWSELT